MAAPGQITARRSAPGHGILTGPDTAGRHDGAGARHPGTDPQFDHRAAAGSRREQLAAAGQSPGQIPRQLRLHHRRAPRRRARSRCSGCATAAPPTHSASRSTHPPATATKTPSCAPGSHRQPARSTRHRLHRPSRRTRTRTLTLTPTNYRGHPLKPAGIYHDQNDVLPGGAPGGQDSRHGVKFGVMWRTRRASDQAATVAFSQVTVSRMHQLYIITLHLFFTAPSVTTWSDMSGNTRKTQVTRLVTLRHRSTMSGALGVEP